MDKLFESINEEDDYEKIGRKIVYQENEEKLKDLYSEKEFVELKSSLFKKIDEEVKLNWGFVFTFGTSITAFFPMVESFIKNSGIDQINFDKHTVVYLGICALAIVFQNPKETYKKLFTELRMRNVYGMLKDLTIFLERLNDVFNFICRKIGKITYDMVGMFSYTLLFVPVLLSFNKIIDANSLSLSLIVQSFVGGSEGIMNIASTAIGTSGLVLREVLSFLIKELKTFKFEKVRKYLSKSFNGIKNKVYSLIKRIKPKLNTNEIEKELKEMEVEKNVGNSKDILKWDDWKKQNDMSDNVERIDEEK